MAPWAAGVVYWGLEQTAVPDAPLPFPPLTDDALLWATLGAETTPALIQDLLASGRLTPAIAWRPLPGSTANGEPAFLNWLTGTHLHLANTPEIQAQRDALGAWLLSWPPGEVQAHWLKDLLHRRLPQSFLQAAARLPAPPDAVMVGEWFALSIARDQPDIVRAMAQAGWLRDAFLGCDPESSNNPGWLYQPGLSPAMIRALVDLGASPYARGPEMPCWRAWQRDVERRAAEGQSIAVMALGEHLERLQALGEAAPALEPELAEAVRWARQQAFLAAPALFLRDSPLTAITDLRAEDAHLVLEALPPGEAAQAWAGRLKPVWKAQLHTPDARGAWPADYLWLLGQQDVKTEHLEPSGAGLTREARAAWEAHLLRLDRLGQAFWHWEQAGMTAVQGLNTAPHIPRWRGRWIASVLTSFHSALSEAEGLDFNALGAPRADGPCLGARLVPHLMFGYVEADATVHVLRTLCEQSQTWPSAAQQELANALAQIWVRQARNSMLGAGEQLARIWQSDAPIPDPWEPVVQPLAAAPLRVLLAVGASLLTLQARGAGPDWAGLVAALEPHASATSGAGAQPSPTLAQVVLPRVRVLSLEQQLPVAKLGARARL